jgi:hypothetical protein
MNSLVAVQLEERLNCMEIAGAVLEAKVQCKAELSR